MIVSIALSSASLTIPTTSPTASKPFSRPFATRPATTRVGWVIPFSSPIMPLTMPSKILLIPSHIPLKSPCSAATKTSTRPRITLKVPAKKSSNEASRSMTRLATNLIAGPMSSHAFFSQSVAATSLATIAGQFLFSHFMPSPTALKTRSASGSSATSTLFLNICHCSEKSRVSRPDFITVSLPFLIVSNSLPRSKRPSRIAAAMSGPARAPKVSIASAFALPAEPAPLICSVSICSAFAGSLTPSLASLPSAIRIEPRTSSVLTPSFSNLPTRPAVSVKLKPSWRSGEPNLTISSPSRET